jgi:hypothetical protein
MCRKVQLFIIIALCSPANWQGFFDQCARCCVQGEKSCCRLLVLKQWNTMKFRKSVTFPPSFQEKNTENGGRKNFFKNFQKFSTQYLVDIILKIRQHHNFYMHSVSTF